MGQLICKRGAIDTDSVTSVTDLTDVDIEEIRPEFKADDMRDPNDFYFMDILGNGSYGKVVRVRDKADGLHYAMKILDKKEIFNAHGHEDLARVKRERKYLRELGNEHPNIVRMHFEINTKNRVYMLLDLCRGGDLRNFFDSHGPCSIEEARFLTAQLFLAITYMHSKQLVHRDVRPLNILISDSGNLRLTDMGIACRISYSETSKMKYHTKRIGARRYRTPEMINKKGYDYSIDYWNAGQVVFELFSGGEYLFPQAVKGIERRGVKIADINPETLAFDEKYDFTEDSIDFIRKLIVHDPLERLGWYHKINYDEITATPKDSENSEEKVEHEPHVDYRELDPEQADLEFPLPPPDIRNHSFFEGIDWIALSRGEVESPVDMSCYNFQPFDENEEPHFKNHLAVLDEFTKRDPNALIAAALA